MIGSYAKNQFPPTIGHDPERDPKGFIGEVLRTVHERNLDQLVQFFAEETASSST